MRWIQVVMNVKDGSQYHFSGYFHCRIGFCGNTRLFAIF